MFRVSVMYPRVEGAAFDLEYYKTTHMELVKKYLKPFGLLRAEVDKGVSGGGDLPAPYVCIGHLYFDTADGYERGVAETGHIVRADIAKFTDIAPIRQISEIVE